MGEIQLRDLKTIRALKVCILVYSVSKFERPITPILSQTHTVTHTRKNADVISGRESAKDYAPPQ